MRSPDGGGAVNMPGKIPGARPPTPQQLVRAQDRMAFVYVQRCVVSRESNAITATNQNGTVHLPAATLGALLLGPGTRVTHQAMTLLAESGSTAVWVGEEGVRYYAHGSSLARSTRLLEAQAAAVSNTRRRLEVARRMYGMRFPGEDVSGLTMHQLRGREGARVRRVYREHSERTGVEWTRRSYDQADFGAGDPINQALTAANVSLYGVVHAVIVALGCAAGLGFVHTGQYRSFVYDIADLYKAEITIPLAFNIVSEPYDEIGPTVRKAVRDKLHGGRFLRRCIVDIHDLLSMEPPDEDEMLSDVVHLWNSDGNLFDSGYSYELST